MAGCERSSSSSMRKQVSLPNLRDMMGRSMASSVPSPTMAGRGPSSSGVPALETMKDLITMKAKGDVGAPYATREKPIAGFDLADTGGAYSSYGSLKEHRIRHTRTANGPNERFDFWKGPPLTSQDLGFGKQNLQPPTYPISSTWVTRSQAEIQKVTKLMKGR